ncbi:MAG: helix-turn-helix transcriptional regulator [Nocardioides sp.]|nr:helix-turn-helix transcriptional regulator [Nocardioides sp.]
MKLRGRRSGGNLPGVGDYGQYCPIARSAEVLAERWTPIIVRNMLNGCRTFGEIRQGAPGIPPAVLTRRLHTLERAGVLVRVAGDSGRGHRYELTQMGLELRDVVDAMGQWGARWIEIEPRHLDAAYVLWATSKLVDPDRIPDTTTVVRFDLEDAPNDRFWLLVRRLQSELCTRPTGYAEDVVCTTTTRCLVEIHLRRTSFASALRSERLRLAGPPRLTRGFGSWFRASPFAPYDAVRQPPLPEPVSPR